VGLFLELKENEFMAEKIAAGVIGTGFIGPVHVEAGSDWETLNLLPWPSQCRVGSQ